MRTLVIGARPRTLPAAVVPVAVGAACAVGEGSVSWWRVGLALVVSLALQIGVNYANDYSDGIRGTDDARVGPVRLVASGLAGRPPVKRAAFVAFSWPRLPGWCCGDDVVVAACRRRRPPSPRLGTTPADRGPYGYVGLGELFVFVFFGLVATVGTTYVAVERFTALAVVWGRGRAAWPARCSSSTTCATSRRTPRAGKRTLAVRIGRRGPGGCTWR